MKKIINIIFFPITTTMIGFEYLCNILSKGFYFYFVKLFEFLKKIFNINIFDGVINHFKRRQNEPEFLLLLMIYVIASVAISELVYVPNEKVVKLNQTTFDIKENQVNFKSNTGVNNSEVTPKHSTYSNKYREYAKTPINKVNVEELSKTNGAIVSWISVDGTNINYPVVKTNDNSYYLDHDIDGLNKKTGWVFNDYRNNRNEDKNTIYYGHNLLNKTAFGSLSNLFTEEWFNSSTKMIVVVDKEFVYTYKIFSIYYIEPEVYYINNNPSDYERFLETITTRSIRNFEDEPNVNDKIITLSTCTEDNLSRKVVHAKLVNKISIK